MWVWLLYVFTSFSNCLQFQNTFEQFEYYTFLHHSQTQFQQAVLSERLNTIRFYIILKPKGYNKLVSDCLNTIRFYIILKRSQTHHEHDSVWILYVFTSFSNRRTASDEMVGLNTIRFYIILKPHLAYANSADGLNTIRFYIILKPVSWSTLCWMGWILYVFTSFSNLPRFAQSAIPVEYYTFLHHSQTVRYGMDTEKRLNTIRFYIILKLCVIVAEKKFRLNTIRFYIILKRCP